MNHLPLALETQTFIDAQRKTDFVCCVTSVILRMRFLLSFCCPACDDLRAVPFTKMSCLHGNFFWLDEFAKLELCFRKGTFFLVANVLNLSLRL